MNTKRFSPHKAARAGVLSTYTNLTQPTELGGELGWLRFYHKPDPNALGGIHQGVLRCRAGLQPECPH